MSAASELRAAVAWLDEQPLSMSSVAELRRRVLNVAENLEPSPRGRVDWCPACASQQRIDADDVCEFCGTPVYGRLRVVSGRSA